MKTRETKITRKAGEDIRDENPGAGEQAGEAVGGIGGTLAGAAIGSMAGPIGTVVGGIAGAVGGWWAGEKAGRAAEDWDEHEDYYKGHWEKNRAADLKWDDAAVGYRVGHIAGRNPDYTGLDYEEIEDDIRRGWQWKDRDYDSMRPYIMTGYDRTLMGP